jgi:uncharacterized membrane protein YhaH (DUF805 family)
MNEKNKAIGKTFLWNIAFGIMISIILAVISTIAFSMLGVSVAANVAEGDTKGIMASGGSTMLILAVAYFAGFIAQFALTYGKCYDYGRDPCVADCDKWKEVQKGEYPKRDNIKP